MVPPIDVVVGIVTVVGGVGTGAPRLGGITIRSAQSTINVRGSICCDSGWTAAVSCTAGGRGVGGDTVGAIAIAPALISVTPVMRTFFAEMFMAPLGVKSLLPMTQRTCNLVAAEPAMFP